MVKRGRRLSFRIITIAFGIMMSLILAEVSVRIIKPASLQAEHTVLHGDYNHRLRSGTTTRAEIGTEKYPVVLRVNSQGLAQERDVLIPKPNGVYRILFIGDSFIQGLGSGRTLPVFVQAGLARMRTQDGRQLEVINGGTQSYSPLLYTARYLHQYAQMQPDAVIIFPDLTDVYDDNARYKHLAEFANGDLVRVHASKAMVAVERTKRILHYDDVPLESYRYLVAKLAHLIALDSSESDTDAEIFEHALDDEANPKPETIEAIRYSIANLRSLIDSLQSKGVHVAIMIYPHRGQIVPQGFDGVAGKRVILNRLFERSLELLGRELGVSVLSFYDNISREIHMGRQLYFSADMHFNVYGLRTLSTSVTEAILASSKETLGVAIFPDNELP